MSKLRLESLNEPLKITTQTDVWCYLGAANRIRLMDLRSNHTRKSMFCLHNFRFKAFVLLFSLTDGDNDRRRRQRPWLNLISFSTSAINHGVTTRRVIAGKRGIVVRRTEQETVKEVVSERFNP